MLQEIPMEDGHILYDPQFLSQPESDRLFSLLEKEIHWEQDEIMMFGKKVLQPRLHAWYGDSGISYTYSGLQMQAKAWTNELKEIKDKISSTFPAQYNSVLLNLYRSGKDSMGWHSDDEKELGKNPIIASLSLGQVRKFHLKHKKRKELETIRLELSHGSLLIMAGKTQHHWKHQIPKTAKNVQPRINLTFREIKDNT
ncbi:MAG: alpha-ketoglutarate-dependent dioxygenase AlkB [Bacteroidota bacterium]